MANVTFGEPRFKKPEVKTKGTGIVRDIIYFVAGTTDPININSEKHQANKKYWRDNQKNFWAKVKELKLQYHDLHIEDEFYSWSGDNDTKERIKAANRLLDTMNRVYSGFKRDDIHLHLIGHSHGGNVINQFTEIIAADRQFSDHWKVKSITYLSTPFFEKIHQLNHTKLHKKCQIINVHNEYDLTQRFVADFSLTNLEYLLRAFNDAELKKAVKKIKLVIDSGVYGVFTEFTNNIDDDNEGPLIWKRTTIILVNVIEILDQLIICINNFESNLNKEKKELLTLFNDIKKWTQSTLNVFTANSNTRKGGYHSKGFLEDLDPLVLIYRLIELLKIEKGVDDSYLLATLGGIFQQKTGITDTIDDTAWSPKNQVKGKFDIRDINITNQDKYNSRGKKANFEKFATGLERSNKANKLKEILMRLFSQFIKEDSLETPIKALWGLKELSYGNLSAQAVLLEKYLKVYKNLIKLYNADLIAKQDLPVEVKTEKKDSSIAFKAESRKKFNEMLNSINQGADAQENKKDEAKPIPGSVAYLATVSHGLSHTQFWKDVEEKLRNSFSSGINTGYSKK
jgi:hypothetical protein